MSPARLLRLLILGFLVYCPLHAALDLISLAGLWRFSMSAPELPPDSTTVPSDLVFTDTIQLPGTTETRSKGPQNKEARLAGLTQLYKFEGQAWYEREIEVPTAWEQRELSLFFERTKACKVWLDGRLVDDSTLLCTEHHLRLGILRPGSHRLTLMIDNRVKIVPGDNHQISEHTQ